MKDNESKNLLCCPFCGAEAELHSWYDGGDLFAVKCSNDAGCNVMPASEGLTAIEAIIKWNTRVDQKIEDKKSCSICLKQDTCLFMPDICRHSGGLTVKAEKLYSLYANHCIYFKKQVNYEG